MKRVEMCVSSFSLTVNCIQKRDASSSPLLRPNSWPAVKSFVLRPLSRSWVFIHEKAYQVTDTGVESSVMTKVKGFGYHNGRVMDVADYVFPQQVCGPDNTWLTPTRRYKHDLWPLVQPLLWNIHPVALWNALSAAQIRQTTHITSFRWEFKVWWFVVRVKYQRVGICSQCELIMSLLMQNCNDVFLFFSIFLHEAHFVHRVASHKPTVPLCFRVQVCSASWPKSSSPKISSKENAQRWARWSIWLPISFRVPAGL